MGKSSIVRQQRAISVFVFAALLGALSFTVPAHATKYGAGSYGRCQYETCSITMSSSASVSVNVLPSPGSTSCTVAKDTVTVTTSSSTGYTLTLIDTDSSINLVSGANTISPTTATFASPAVLSASMWGYRVDSIGSFGAGPTSAQSNAAVPTQTYATVQPSTGTADTITTTSSAASSGNVTSVWYGLCVNASVPSGTYSDSVVYTALIN